MHWQDHTLAAVLIALYPAYSWMETRRAKAKLKLNPTDFDTVSDYKQTISHLVALAVVCVAIWIVQGRSLALLGMDGGSSTVRWLGGAALALVGIGLTQWQATQLGRDDGARAQLESQLGDILFLLPKSARELNWFYAVSLAAGVCEEILFRGFLIWYFAHWVGSIPALFASSIAFGIAHSYQGAANIPRTAFIGLWMGTIYLVTGSLWLAMLTHFVYDVIGGRIIYLISSEAAEVQ